MKHKPGWVFLTATRSLVRCESRNEMAALLYAEYLWRRSLDHVVHQPLWMLNGEPAKPVHAPDFLLFFADRSPLLLDVTTPSRYRAQRSADQRALSRQLAESMAWQYEMVAGPGEALLANLNLLARYRRPWPDLDWLAPWVLQVCTDPMRVDQAAALISDIADVHEVLVRPAILHLLWTGDLTTEVRRSRADVPGQVNALTDAPIRNRTLIQTREVL